MIGPSRPVCGHDGCGLPVLCSLDGRDWYHWVEDLAERRWGNSVIQSESRRGGRHHASPPDGFDVAAHVAALRTDTQLASPGGAS